MAHAYYLLLESVVATQTEVSKFVLDQFFPALKLSYLSSLHAGFLVLTTVFNKMKTGGELPD